MAGTKGRSARGHIVDFDVLTIKAKLEKVEKPIAVKEREDFIASKSKRKRSVKKVAEITATAEPEVESAGVVAAGAGDGSSTDEKPK